MRNIILFLRSQNKFFKVVTININVTLLESNFQRKQSSFSKIPLSKLRVKTALQSLRYLRISSDANRTQRTEKQFNPIGMTTVNNPPTGGIKRPRKTASAVSKDFAPINARFVGKRWGRWWTLFWFASLYITPTTAAKLSFLATALTSAFCFRFSFGEFGQNFFFFFSLMIQAVLRVHQRVFSSRVSW